MVKLSEKEIESISIGLEEISIGLEEIEIGLKEFREMRRNSRFLTYIAMVNVLLCFGIVFFIPLGFGLPLIFLMLGLLFVQAFLFSKNLKFSRRKLK